MHTTTRIAAVAAVAGIAALGLAACSSSRRRQQTRHPHRHRRPTALRSADTLSICTTNLGSPPNITTDESGNLVGSEIDLAKAVAGRLGLTPDFVTVDFSALIPSLQAKQCDVIMASLYIKPERKEVVDFVPYLTSATGVAVKQGSDAGITGLDDSLCGKKVMVTVGTTAQDLAEKQSTACTSENKKPLDISTNNQATVGFQQLVSGQLDAYLDAAELIGYYQKQGTAGIEMVGDPTDAIDIGAAPSRTTPRCTTASRRRSTTSSRRVTTPRFSARGGRSPSPTAEATDGELRLGLLLEEPAHPGAPFLQGLALTVLISVLAMAGALVVGLVIALMRRSAFAPLRVIASLYIWLIRGTPLLVQLVIIYTGFAAANVFRFQDVDLGGILVKAAIQAAIVGLIMNESAYISEIIRAGLDSVPSVRPRRRRPSACRGRRRCGGSSCPSRCGSWCPRSATRSTG